MSVRPCALVPVLIVLLTGCGSSESKPTVPADSVAQLAPDPAGPPAAWSYEGATGPSKWATLSDAYAACNGDQQSPIALTGATSGEERTFNARYIMELGNVVDTGYTIQVNTSGGMVMYDGMMHGLRQFHVHVPAEHTVDGTTYPAEVHLVHRARNGHLVVLGVFVEKGKTANPALTTWITGADTTITFRPGRLFPEKQTHYTYRGSLTTPPCSENVRWIVMDTPITASEEQLETLRTQYSNNARPIQPTGDRRLTYVTP